jgi:hypothetical protein
MAKTFKVYNGDIVTNAATGRFTLVSGASKVSQDLNEFFTIEVLSNGFGAGIEQMIGVVESSVEMFTSLTARQILDGLSTFIRLIRSSPQINRTPEEQIISVSNIQVSASPSDPSTFFFSVNVITAAGTSSTVKSSINIS